MILSQQFYQVFRKSGLLLKLEISDELEPSLLAVFNYYF